MEISPFLLFFLLVASFAFGGTVGILNDIHRLIRVILGVRYSKNRFDRWYEKEIPFLNRPIVRNHSSKKNKTVLSILIFVQDLILFSFAAVGTVTLNFYFNNGKFRLYTIAALIMGFLLYYFTLGRLIMLLSEGIVFVLKAFLSILFHFLLVPFKKIVGFFGKNIKKLYRKAKKTIAKLQKKRYNISKQESVLKEAEVGFFGDK